MEAVSRLQHPASWRGILTTITIELPPVLLELAVEVEVGVEVAIFEGFTDSVMTLDGVFPGSPPGLEPPWPLPCLAPKVLDSDKYMIARNKRV